MNHEQAKFILQSYRSGGDSATDPNFAEALRELEASPALRAWFEREQAFDAVAAAKLSEVAPPPDLRSAILAGGRVSRRRPLWRRPLSWGLAAGFAVLFALSSFAWRLAEPRAADSLPEFAVSFASRGYIGLQERSNDLVELTRWLAEHNAPLPARVPPELASLRRLGCRTVEFKGRDISVICFDRGKEFHLFVARRADFPALPGSSEPQFHVERGWAAATWADQNLHYVLVSEAGVDAVRGLL